MKNKEDINLKRKTAFLNFVKGACIVLIVGIVLELISGTVSASLLVTVSDKNTSGFAGDVMLAFCAAMYSFHMGVAVMSVLGGAVIGVVGSSIPLVLNFVFSSTFMGIAQDPEILLVISVCAILRNTKFLDRKRNVPIAALILGIIMTIERTIDSRNLDLTTLLTVLMFFVLYTILFFLVRIFMPKAEKWLPVRESRLEKVYRTHSIKRRLQLIVNALVIAVVALFVVQMIGDNNYDVASSSDIYIKNVNDTVATELADQLSALDNADDLSGFDMTAFSNVLSENTSDRFYIKKIQLVDLGNEYISNIEYDDHGEVTSVSQNEKFANPELLQDMEHFFPYSENILVTYSVGDVTSTSSAVISSFADFFLPILALFNVFLSWLLDKMIVMPINSMTSAADDFAFDTDEDRGNAVEKFKALDIKSGDEIEQLYHAVAKTMDDMNEQIVQIKTQARHISDMQHNIIITMADIVESRDENTGGHIRRTAEYVRIIAEKLREKGQYSDILTDRYVDDMVVAAPLHDMGKIHVSDTILNKPGKLDDKEFTIMKTHTTYGRDMLEHAVENLGAFSYLNMAVLMAGYHHEKWNGRGYPEGLSGQDIPLCARIMAVADVFDALVSKRCYKAAMPLEKAYSIIREESGNSFDPVIVDAFFDSTDDIEKTLKTFG
ncbi:HD domain-containing phosphohydrolase [Ruminococcus sp.]|uniref:HD domain-containing phosphohydrolase n=1 Tax=Ruminococcus sp. TaxID=41978 RepID=UPI0025F11BF1|nr:HD domain-containing phosphohydrolase [Ruminococcus sp.]